MINIDTLVEKSIGTQLKNEMEISLRAIYGVVQKYSFLHDGDLQKTQNMISDAFFSKKTPILVNDEIQVDMKEIVKNVPDEIKMKIYNMIQEELATKVSVDFLASKD